MNEEDARREERERQLVQVHVVQSVNLNTSTAAMDRPTSLGPWQRWRYISSAESYKADRVLHFICALDGDKT